MIYHGDCLEVLKTLPDNSVDSIVTDPPYDLTSNNCVYKFKYTGSGNFCKEREVKRKGFMGKEWDGTGIAFKVELWQECLRVLKPGGHLLAFSGTRTYHRMAVAIEDAGFEVRDMLEYIYASGFPKSLNVGKAVDKLQGNEREQYQISLPRDNKNKRTLQLTRGADVEADTRTVKNSGNAGIQCKLCGCHTVSIKTGRLACGHPKDSGAVSDKAKQWEGFGTALKPAHEPICMARKPLSEKTIVENVLKHGTGAIDIDGCRIPTSENEPDKRVGTDATWGGKREASKHTVSLPAIEGMLMYKPEGRFPANIICTDDALNDGVMTKSTARPNSDGKIYKSNTYGNGRCNMGNAPVDSGSKSRYFDIDCWGEKHGLLQFPKASKRERNEGCEGLEAKANSGSYQFRTDGSLDGKSTQPKTNSHPTVKPVHLMSWLVRLVTPPDGVCLDPFAGSFTTGVACKMIGRDFIGIEKEKEYFEIGKARIEGVKIEKTLF